MPENNVEKEQEPELLSVQKLRSENEALTKRVATLEKQVKDMISELSTGSYTVVNENGNNAGSNKDELNRKVKKVFGNGKID